MMEQSELSKALNNMLDELPSAFRDVLILIDVYELDYVETAQSLNISMGTVKSRLARARLLMQKKIKSMAESAPHPVHVPADFSESLSSDVTSA
jgi:RNA polymerase sigma-70 factor (ECF subfamily)